MSLGKTVTALSIGVFLEVPTVISIEVERTLSGNGKNIHLPTTEVLLRALTGNLEKSRKLHDQTFRNAVLLQTFLKEMVFTNGETAIEALLEILAKRIHEHEEYNAWEESDKD